ncbi:MAG: MFS transporter, partial [Clostridiales bacterium]|nr:MFS transporter [Clostridiales bacterium]
MNIVSKLYHELTGHWKTPKEGNSLGYKEILLHGIGGNGVSLFEGMNGYAGTAVTSALTAMIYGILPMHIWLIGMIVALVSLVRMPLTGFIIDNTNTKLGKFRPLILMLAIPSALLLIALAYIPAQFMTPDGYTARLVSFTIISALLAFFLPTLSTVYEGLSQVMTMNTQERGGFFAILNVIRNLSVSVMQIVLPLFSVMVGGMEHITIYQIAFPILVVIGVGASLASVFGVKERMIIPKDKSNKVSFWLGMKRCIKNKYFLIKVSSDILSALRGSANIVFWICIYSIGGDKGNQVFGIAAAVLGFGHVPGMLLAPLIVKKFGKQRSFIGTHILGILTTLPMLFFLNSPFMLLAM